MRVLIVEDDADQRRILALIVRSRGHEPIECASLAEASAAGECDLALVDRRLPDGDGLEWARTRDGPVYLLTGEEETVVGIPVLLKPVRARELDALLGST